MSDEQIPDASAPPPPQPSPPPVASDPRGTLGRGIAQFFLCVVGGGLLALVIVTVTYQILKTTSNAIPDAASAAVALLLTLAPWLVALVVGVRHAMHGRTRTALGMVVGLGILVGLLILLMAACFGIVATMGARPLTMLGTEPLQTMRLLADAI